MDVPASAGVRSDSLAGRLGQIISNYASLESGRLTDPLATLSREVTRTQGSFAWKQSCESAKNCQHPDALSDGRAEPERNHAEPLLTPIWWPQTNSRAVRGPTLPQRDGLMNLISPLAGPGQNSNKVVDTTMASFREAPAAACAANHDLLLGRHGTCPSHN